MSKLGLKTVSVFAVVQLEAGYVLIIFLIFMATDSCFLHMSIFVGSQLHGIMSTTILSSQHHGSRTGQNECIANYSTVDLSQNQMMGTAGELPKAPERKTLFMEDMTEATLNKAVRIVMPPLLRDSLNITTSI